MNISGSAAGDNQRILASLEQGGKPVAPRGRSATRQLDSWIIGIGSVVVVLAACAWVAVRDSAETPTPASGRNADEGRMAASATPAGPVGPNLPAAQIAPVAPAAPDQAAAIINEAAAPASPAPALAGTVTASPQKPGGHVVRSAQQHSGATSLANARPTPHAASLTSGNRRSAGAGNAARPAPANTTAAASTPDSDVALLTALVAHANKPAVVVPERSRDVVERRDDDNTESLLSRCKQLGLIEGMLCRSRICAGRWDSDPACRAPSH